MAQIICIAPKGRMVPQHGGVKFFNSEFGRISEEISDDKAAEFLKQETQFRLHTGEPIEVGDGIKPSRKANELSQPVARQIGAPTF